LPFNKFEKMVDNNKNTNKIANNYHNIFNNKRPHNTMKTDAKHIINGDIEFFVTLVQRAYLVLFISCVVMGLFVENAAAGTGGDELTEVQGKLEGLIKGKGGQIAGMLAMASGVIGYIVTGNFKILIPPVVAGAILSIGPSIVTSGISALI